MKKIILITLFIVLFSSFVSAVCTVTMTPDPIPKGQTITFEIVCSEQIEKNRAYLLNITDQANNILAQLNGTTPNVVNTDFFETYQVPLATTATSITGTLVGTNLEGTDTVTVTGAATNELIINDCKFKPKAFIGADFSVDCEILNNASKKIDNAHCFVYATDENGAPLQMAELVSESINGRFVASGILKPENLKEDTSYLAKLKCHCETGDNKCWDEDGLAIENYQGESAVAFQTAKWLNVNTLVDMSEYEARQVAIVSVNVTNVDGEDRLPILIYKKHGLPTP